MGCLCILGLAAAHTQRLHLPRAVSGPKSAQPGGSGSLQCPWKLYHPRPVSGPRNAQPGGSGPITGPRNLAQGCHCSQAGAGSQPRLWGHLSPCGTALASLLVLPALVLPVPHCLGVASRAALVLASAGELWGCARPGCNWKLHHLELFSSERCFQTHSVLVALFIWCREASSPSFPHVTAPFPTLGGWNIVLPLPSPLAPGANSQRRGRERIQLLIPCWVERVTGDMSWPQWSWVREEQ